MRNLLTFITIGFFILSLSACSFVQDRSQDEVQIVDAADAKSVSKPNKPTLKPAPIKPVEYRVVKGDTLGVIASKMMGSASLFRQLADYNNIDINQSLTIGQLLLIPSKYHSPTTTITAFPSKTQPVITNIASKINFEEMDQLLIQKEYNQAIDWAMSNPQLASSDELQNKLVLATQRQVDIERSEKDYSEASFLIQGLLQDNKFSQTNQNQLTQLSTQITCEKASYSALLLAQKDSIDKAYPLLSQSFKTDSNYSLGLDDFIDARLLVTESMHQEALKLYRNQQLEPALNIWNDILEIKPNDDLALVYKDRVYNLQQKLKEL